MIETSRLILRGWREADIAPFHAMSQDIEVMRYLGPATALDQSRAAAERMVARQAESGFCFWALERKRDASFIGFCGLLPGKPPIAGEIEIGWRLARDAWGQGYAGEAARASLEWAWANLDVQRVQAITVPANLRSWGLMERLGMTRVDGGDFDHPDVSDDSPLKRHILYSIDRPTA
uniref:GNAT family N-acetyltransferase n=1 Tax=uncultured Sphingomonas sp. TaxID=158754 RepID=UPI0035CA75E5